MRRVGRIVILGRREELVTGPPPNAAAEAARITAVIERQQTLLRQGDEIIARQYDALTKAEGELAVVRTQVRERNELLLEQQIALDALNERLASVMRHPVTGEPPREAA